MLHPLQRKIDSLRRRVRLADAVRGFCFVAAALLCTIVALGSIDYLLRLEDRGLRIIASLSALGVLGWTSYRVLGKTLFARLPDADLARRVERSFPALRNRLLSAVQFLGEAEDDPTAGSPALRRAVVARVEADARSVDFTSLLDRRRPARAVALLAAVCLVAGVPVALAPATARTAVARMVNPLGDAPWPRTTHLEIRRPLQRVARGRPFQVEAVDARGARLPSEVRIHYRLEGADGAVIEETERMRLVKASAVARRENVQRPFSFRIEGGDDQSMPWREVEVVEPPSIESLSIRLVPPSYTGRPAARAERHIRALRGTRVHVAAKSNKPLDWAALCLENGKYIPAEIGDDGRSLKIGGDGAPLIVEESGSYWFELTDREGLHGDGERWEIRAVADSPPKVVIRKPAANLFVTPTATAPIGVAAKDDLAIARIGLAFRLDESGPERRLTLFAGPEGAPRRPADEIAAPIVEGDSRSVDYRWDLAPLALKPGMKVTFYATADDYLTQSGKSDPRRLIVVTSDDLRDRIADREQLVAAELDRALAMQRGCRRRIEALRLRLAEPRRLGQPDVDRLQAAEHAQREVNQLLTSGGEGLPMHVLALLADLENNRVDNSNVQRRMESLLDELQRLDRQRLRAIGSELTAAVKSARIDLKGEGGDVPIGGRVADSLAAAARNQDAVIASLEQWIGQLARWDSYARFHRQLGRLLRDQEESARGTAEVGRRTLARRLRDLSTQDAAKLAAAAAGQLELARRLERLLQEMDQALDLLRRQDAQAADCVAAVLEEARRRAVAAGMRAAADRIMLNRIGQAAAGQKRIARDLREILALATKRGRSETAPGDSNGESEDNRQRAPTDSHAENGRPGAKPGNSMKLKPDGAGDRKADMQRTRAAMRRLWGELPPHVREQMLQSPVEEFPPKYELLIEEYFRRLAEEKTKK